MVLFAIPNLVVSALISTCSFPWCSVLPNVRSMVVDFGLSTGRSGKLIGKPIPLSLTTLKELYYFFNIEYCIVFRGTVPEVTYRSTRGGVPTWPESSVPVTPKHVPWPTKNSPSFLEKKSHGRNTPNLIIQLRYELSTISK